LTLEPLPALGQPLSGGRGPARWGCAMGVHDGCARSPSPLLARINFAGADDLK